ncbi:hypothetical protein BMF94_1140 [Rhodotorula taiwanensis]|uniref:Glycosylphosphatidylinositol anchor biosynthesis protein 11 n=1 Tax=Rhodotorula taiwanensis TaxID=741276 RepID=A0A2S5BGD4_9BASI|nr:hypothetical protein BMF94_1140 [Rhodotorula taiwanensis]
MVRKSATTAAPSPQLAVASAPASAMSAPSSVKSIRRDPLLVEHYIPRVPLQLVAISFALLAPLDKGDGSQSRPERFLTALVENPVKTISVSSALVAVVQVWFGYWARSCRLRALREEEDRKYGRSGAGTERAQARPPRRGLFATMRYIWSNQLRPFGSGPQMRRPDDGRPSVKLDTSFLPQTLLVTLVGAAAFHAVAVLLGASFVHNASLTAMLSLFLSLLTITPLSIAIPPRDSDANRYTWLRLSSTLRPANDLELALFAPALGAIIGCWSGAFPIPLDWDRPWQRYPTTSVLGAVAGHAIGSIVSLLTVSYRAAVRTASEALEDVKRKERETSSKAVPAAAKGKGKSR